MVLRERKAHQNKQFSIKATSTGIISGTLFICLSASNVATAESDTEKVKDVATNKAAALATNKADNLLSPYFDHLDLSISGGENRKPEGNLTGVRAYDDDGNKNAFVFNQLGINRYDGRTTVNIGLGYRVLTLDNKWMFGGNVFYDHEFPNDHQRNGLGIEARSSVLRLSANSYSGMSDYKKDKSGTDSKALSGSDAKVELALPYLPGSKLTYRTFKWSGIDGASDTKGYTVGLKGYLTNNLLFEAGRTNFTGTSTASSRDEVCLSSRLNFFDDEPEKLYRISNKAYELTPLGSERYEPVERENRIIKQKKFATTVSGV